MSFRHFFPVIILLVFFASACAKKPPCVLEAEKASRTKRAESLEANLKRMNDATATVKALARLELEDNDGLRNTEAALVIARPDRIRVDAIDALADVWAEVGSDGKRIWLFLPQKNRLRSGKATRRNLYRFARFDMEVSDFLSLLTGLPPLDEDFHILQVGKENKNHFIIRGADIHLWTDGKRGRILKIMRVSDEGRCVDYELTFADYRRIGDVWFPYRIEASFPRQGTKSSVEYLDVSLGDGIDDEIFKPRKTVRRRGKRSRKHR